MCPGCVREEEVPSSILRRAEERDQCLLSDICMFKRGVWPKVR